jgi:hypothetical protein
MPASSSSDRNTSQCSSFSRTMRVLSRESHAPTLPRATAGLSGLGKTTGLVARRKNPSSTIHDKPRGSSPLTACSHHARTRRWWLASWLIE